MRSNNRKRNLGIQHAQPSAKSIAHRDVDRPSLFALWCAATGYATRPGHGLRAALGRFTTATRVGMTRVTGGALCTVAVQRSGRRSSMRRSAG